MVNWVGGEDSSNIDLENMWNCTRPALFLDTNGL